MYDLWCVSPLVHFLSTTCVYTPKTSVAAILWLTLMCVSHRARPPKVTLCASLSSFGAQKSVLCLQCEGELFEYTCTVYCRVLNPWFVDQY